MERRSDKHGSRIDEGLKHDTDSIVHGAPVESRAAEGREQEGPADDEPTPDSLLVGEARDGAGDGLTHEEVEARTELARHLQGAIFPATPAELAESARRMQASDDLVERLGALPDGSYDHVEAVWEALGGRAEFRG